MFTHFLNVHTMFTHSINSQITFSYYCVLVGEYFTRTHRQTLTRRRKLYLSQTIFQLVISIDFDSQIMYRQLMFQNIHWCNSYSGVSTPTPTHPQPPGQPQATDQTLKEGTSSAPWWSHNTQNCQHTLRVHGHRIRNACYKPLHNYDIYVLIIVSTFVLQGDLVHPCQKIMQCTQSFLLRCVMI